MTMHLCHPSLSTTGKKKGRAKHRNSAQAQAARQARDDWADLLKRHGAESDARRERRSMTAAPLGTKYKLAIPAGRDTMKDIKSLKTDGGVALKAAVPVYTGDKIIGIGTLHKSNAVPIFSNEEAIEISKMRRG